MMNKNSNPGRYILAALVGAAAGGLLVAVTSRALPKMISGSVPETPEADCEAGDICKRMMANMRQASEPAACVS